MSAGMEKGLKYCQDQSSIMLLFEQTFRHNAVVLRVTLKSTMLRFSSIMYLTLVIRLVLFLEFLSFQVQFQPIPLVSLSNNILTENGCAHTLLRIEGELCFILFPF